MMETLGGQREEIPHRDRTLGVIARISLERMNDIRKLEGVPYEEDWMIVANLYVVHKD